MKLIFDGIKILIMAFLAIFYWPLNTALMWLQKHYRKWQVEDRTSYYIATPLYYSLYFITVLLSLPLEMMGEAAHPPLSGFR